MVGPEARIGYDTPSEFRERHPQDAVLRAHEPQIVFEGCDPHRELAEERRVRPQRRI